MRLTAAQLAHIQSLEDKHGRLTAKRLLADARRPKSPLHGLRVWRGWNAKHATEKWWLHCAQLVIGAVTIVVTNQTSTVKAPCYIVDAGGDGEGYRSVLALKADTPAARESLIYTLEVAAGHLRRALDLAGPLGLAREVEDLLAQIAGVQLIAEKKAA